MNAISQPPGFSMFCNNNPYTLIIRKSTSGYQLRLKIGNQFFNIGHNWETKKEAAWFRDQFNSAIKKIINHQNRK